MYINFILIAKSKAIAIKFLFSTIFRVRVLTTVFFIFIAIFVIRQWPDVRDIGSHMMRHLKESLMVK